MTISTLNERIANAEARIEKKRATIEKKRALAEKKAANLDKMSDNERYWAQWDIMHLNEDVERNEKEIAEIEATLENYRKQLAGETEKEEMFVREIPELMKRMQNELVTLWDEWDKKRRDELRAAYRELGWREFYRKFKRADGEFKDKTDDEIHKSNERDAKALIIDLYTRVRHITGEVTDWNGIHAEVGTWGFTVLNGIVAGKQGRCRVESILAGGYNIQRLHVRVLTHEIN